MSTPVNRLGGRARSVRLVVALTALGLLTAGTLVGSDNDFPFGPFRMYATRDDPNGTVRQAVVLAVRPDGATRDVTDTPGAPRRAELEGRISRLRRDPDRWASIARHYLPGAGRATSIRLVWRSYPLHHGRTGPHTDAVIATWRIPSTGGG